MADLTHDNRDEMIVLERLETDYFSGMLHIYHVSDGGVVVEIYEDDVGEVQLGWRWYYLYKDMDDREYLVQYKNSSEQLIAAGPDMYLLGDSLYFGG